MPRRRSRGRGRRPRRRSGALASASARSPRAGRRSPRRRGRPSPRTVHPARGGAQACAPALDGPRPRQTLRFRGMRITRRTTDAVAAVVGVGFIAWLLWDAGLEAVGQSFARMGWGLLLALVPYTL